MQQTDGWMVGHWAAEEAHSSTTHVSALVSKHAIIEGLASLPSLVHTTKIRAQKIVKLLFKTPHCRA